MGNMMINMTPDGAGARSPEGLEPSVAGLESGTYESAADPEHAWMRRDSTGETVRARITAYPRDFVFESGDETGIELVDGQWHALPSVVHTVRLKSRIEWWTRNRSTGDFRFLAEKRLDTGRPRPESDHRPGRRQT